MGQLEFGVYDDDYANVPVKQLEQHYGVHGNVISRLPGQTGAGHPADEDDGDLDADDDSESWIDTDEADEAIAEADKNVYSEPVSAPENTSPFTSDDQRRLFATMLDEYQRRGHIPSGYGMLRDEWEGGVYPTIQIIPSGRRGSKQLRIGLPDNIWSPRSKLWVQALDIMAGILGRHGV